MYTKKDCAGDYYILQGHNVGYSKTCVNLHGGSKQQIYGNRCFLQMVYKPRQIHL
jgi:hypothetical protein